MSRAEIEAEIRRLAAEPEFTDNPSFYLYDLDVVDRQLGGLEVAMPPGVELYYAMKANPHPRMLAHMRQRPYVRGVEIASQGEMRLAARVFDPAEIIFTGPAKTVAQLEEAVATGVRQVHVESVVEAIRLSRIAARRGAIIDVLIRVNVAFRIAGAHNRAAGNSTKFGIDEESLAPAVTQIRQLPGLRVIGLHLFAGSGILHHEFLLEYLAHALDLARAVDPDRRWLEIVDFGGGFGIDYEGRGRTLDVAALGEGMGRVIESIGLQGTRIIFELGRYLVGEAGFYVTEIVDIKESRGKKHVITAGGTNHQRRPMQFKTNHPTFVLSMGRLPMFDAQPRVANEIVDVGGPLCTGNDVLATDLRLERAEIGDLLVVECSGAYGASVGMVNFLSHPPAPEHFFTSHPKRSS